MANTAQKHLSLLHGVTLTESDFSAVLRRNVSAWSTELGLKEGSGTLEVAKSVSARITSAIQSGESDGLTLPALGKSIREAAKIGRAELLGKNALRNVSLERLHELGSEPLYWQSRIIGEIRQHLVGLRGLKDVEKVFVRLLREGENIKAIQGPDGYRWVAELFCQGNMLKAYQLMSAVCKAEKLDFKKFEWGAQFNGTTKDFQQLRAEVQAGFSDLSNFRYRGISGYEAFASSRCQGSMLKAYQLMSAVCKAEKLDFKKLEWGAAFMGTTKEFQALGEEVQAGFADLANSEYQGVSGYETFATRRCQGSMLKAYKLMSAICKAESLDFKKLEWGACFQGTTKDFQALRATVREGFVDSLKFEYQGVSGYEAFAARRCQGSMQKAYKLMSAVCKAGGLDFKKLGWGAAFMGTTKEFQELRAKVREGFADSPKFEYQGLSGYEAFASSHCQGSMDKAYKLMSAVCKAEKLDFKKLEWGAAFMGTTKEFQGLRAEVRACFPGLNNFRYQGISGYADFADSCCQGSMLKAYLLMSAVCQAESADFRELEWGAAFMGTTKEFQELRAKVQAGFSDLSNFRYRGISGYEAFASSRCQGSMKKAYIFMSAVCKAEKLDFKKLEWGAQFGGTTKEFQALRAAVREGFHNLSSFRYANVPGYVRFADEICRGNMLKAALIMRAICKADGCNFLELNWGKRFKGTTAEFQASRASGLNE